MYVSPRNCPDHIRRQGRPIIPDFDLKELLYLRFGADDFVDGQLVPSAIRVPKQSVNRGSLSQPEDVLFNEQGKYDGLGAVEFKVEDIPQTVAGDQGPIYVFFMQHDPREDNYPHSEIWSDHAPGTGNCREPSKSVKLKFRIELCKRIRVEGIRIPAVRNRG